MTTITVVSRQQLHILYNAQDNNVAVLRIMRRDGMPTQHVANSSRRAWLFLTLHTIVSNLHGIDFCQDLANQVIHDWGGMGMSVRHDGIVRDHAMVSDDMVESYMHTDRLLENLGSGPAGLGSAIQRIIERA